ncbi:conserved hypothetical protein [Gammaproteobacteria bacterium]
MAIIKLEQVNAGMIIADNIKDRSGRVLLRSGTELTDKHIKILKTWGIRCIEISGADDAIETTPVIIIDPVLLAKAAKIADTLFQHVDREHSAMKELSALCVQHLAQQLGNRGHDA